MKGHRKKRDRGEPFTLDLPVCGAKPLEPWQLTSDRKEVTCLRCQMLSGIRRMPIQMANFLVKKRWEEEQKKTVPNPMPS
jgi:hypothetical protein